MHSIYSFFSLGKVKAKWINSSVFSMLVDVLRESSILVSGKFVPSDRDVIRLPGNAGGSDNFRLAVRLEWPIDEQLRRMALGGGVASANVIGPTCRQHEEHLVALGVG